MADEKRKLKHTTAEVDMAVEAVGEHSEQIQQNAEKLSAEVARAKSAEATLLSTIGLTKKNILPIKGTAASTTSNGITFTRSADGTITASGTASGTATYAIIAYGSSLPLTWDRTQKMRITGVPNNYSASDGVAIAFGVRSDTTSSMVMIGTDRGAGAEFEIPADSIQCQVFVRVNAGVTLDNVVFRPMLTYADIDLGGKTGYEAYEPYVDDLYAAIQTIVSRIEAIENAAGIVATSASETEMESM